MKLRVAQEKNMPRGRRRTVIEQVQEIQAEEAVVAAMTPPIEVNAMPPPNPVETVPTVYTSGQVQHVTYSDKMLTLDHVYTVSSALNVAPLQLNEIYGSLESAIKYVASEWPQAKAEPVREDEPYRFVLKEGEATIRIEIEKVEVKS